MLRLFNALHRLAPVAGIAAALLCFNCAERNNSPVAAQELERGLSVYIASTEREVSLSRHEVGPEGKSLFLAPEPLLTHEYVRKATLGRSNDGRPTIMLELTEPGAAILRENASRYVGGILVFLWDGRVVYAPRVMSPLGSKLMIVGGSSSLPADLLHEMLERLPR